MNTTKLRKLSNDKLINKELIKLINKRLKNDIKTNNANSKSRI